MSHGTTHFRYFTMLDKRTQARNLVNHTNNHALLGATDTHAPTLVKFANVLQSIVSKKHNLYSSVSSSLVPHHKVFHVSKHHLVSSSSLPLPKPPSRSVFCSQSFFGFTKHQKQFQSTSSWLNTAAGVNMKRLFCIIHSSPIKLFNVIRINDSL